MQLQWVAMQATGCLPFTSMLLAGHMHVSLVFWYIKSGLPFTSMLLAGHLHGHLHVSSVSLVHQVREPWKSQTALVIDQTSNWSLAICLLLKQVGRSLN